jgi:FkbM family methyltransferase
MRVTLNEASQSRWRTDDAEHLRYEYELAPHDVVIDLGAYRGEWAAEIYRRYQCRVICVEPGPWIVGFPHGEVINKAAWTHNGTLRFGGAFYYTSALELATHDYPCFDIYELLGRYEETALLKMNVEGAEYALLEHILAAGFQRRIRNLQVQFHLIDGEDSEGDYDRIAAELNKTHTRSWYYRHTWENWRRR